MITLRGSLICVVRRFEGALEKDSETVKSYEMGFVWGTVPLACESLSSLDLCLSFGVSLEHRYPCERNIILF